MTLHQINRATHSKLSMIAVWVTPTNLLLWPYQGSQNLLDDQVFRTSGKSKNYDLNALPQISENMSEITKLKGTVYIFFYLFIFYFLQHTCNQIILVYHFHPWLISSIPKLKLFNQDKTHYQVVNSGVKKLLMVWEFSLSSL